MRQAHLGILEGAPEDAALLVSGLNTLIGVSYVDETEVFKTCLDYWNFFVPEVRGVEGGWGGLRGFGGGEGVGGVAGEGLGEG